MKCLTSFAWPMLLLLFCAVPAAAEEARLPSSPAVPDQAAVEASIDQLTGIDSFDVGLSTGMGGGDFPPVAGQARYGAGLLSPNIPHRRNEALLHLVEAGPSALPALLKHLDDTRLTKLIAEHRDIIGSMDYATEVPEPKWAGPREKKALEFLPGEMPRKPISKHEVTVGDACFVIVGMITNREYNAVRYQPTACLVVNSPTHDAAIAKAVRAIWGENPQAGDVRDSLVRDFDHRDESAAVRLLYYFPGFSTDMILARLKALAARGDPSLAAYLRTIAWSQDSRIRAAIRPIVSSSKDPAVVGAGAGAFAEESRRDELVTLFQRWKNNDADHDGSAAISLLTIALRSAHGQQAGTLNAFLAKGGESVRLNALRACYAVDTPPLDPLRPLLDVRSIADAEYLTEGEGVLKQPGPADRSSYRICDFVYELIGRALGDRETKCTGGAGEMDRRIETLEKRLAANTKPFSEEEVKDRQADQNRVAATRKAALDRIESSGESPACRAVMTLEDDSLTGEDREAALASLYFEPFDPEDSDRRLLGIGNPASIETVMSNRNRNQNRKLLFDDLDSKWQKRLLNLMAAKIDLRLRDTLPGKYPATALCNCYSLACLRQPEINRASGVTLMAQVDAAYRKQGWPSVADSAQPVLDLVDVLLEQSIPGAAEWFAQVVTESSPKKLHVCHVGNVVLKILVAHRDKPELQKAAEEIFLSSRSPWNPTRLNQAGISDFEDADLLKLPPFRKALLLALKDSSTRDQELGKLTVHPGGVNIDWDTGDPNADSSSIMGIDEGEPCGAKRGGPPMIVRRADCLLHAIGETHGQPRETPEFQVYWPKDRRDEAIRQWLDYLSKFPSTKEK